MADGTRITLAKEGRSLLITAGTAAVLTTVLGYAWLALFLWAALFVLMFLLRVSERRVPPVPLGVVSPIDGRVADVRRVHDPFLDREAVRVIFRISPLGEYVTCSPVEGRVANHWFLPAHTSEPQVGAAPEQPSWLMGRPRNALWLQTDEKDDLVLILTASPFSQPRCYVHPGERVGQGQRCGYAMFGSQLAMLLPANARMEVQSGSVVRAGSDLVARFVHG